MHREARMPRQPCPYIRWFGGGVIVGDQMEVEPAWRLAMDLLEETQPFDVGVARLGSRDQLARHLLEGGEQRDRAMADVIVCHRARALARQRQAQLCAF